MPKFDITKLNVAVDRLLDTTRREIPGIGFLLQAFSCHRYLEVSGRYEEILAADMTGPGSRLSVPLYRSKNSN